MKKAKIILLYVAISLFVVFSSACSTATANYESPINFYYIHNDLEFGTESGVIKATIRESKGHTDDYTFLINQYLNGPISYDCISPFPAGTTLEELSWDQNRVQIVLSPHITTLNGIDLIVACSCLTKTVTEMTGINTVQIRSSRGLLNGEQVLTLSADSFIFWDQATASDSLD